jgi:O-antigen ligase
VKPVTGVALALFFTVVQFYTSLAALSPTPPVGYLFAGRAVAGSMVALLALSACVCAVRLAREHAVLPGPSRALLTAWIGSAALASLLGIDPLSGLQVVGIMLLSAAFHLALVRYYAEPGVARTLFVAYLWAGTFALAAAIVMLLAHRPASLWVLNNGRAAGVFVTANQCAAFAIVFGFVAFGVALSSAGRLRLLGAAGTSAALVALVATFSQAGALGAAAGAVFLSFAVGARRVALGLGLACLLAAIAIGSRPVHGHDPSDAFDRLRTWRSGLRVAELFPLTGAGPMAYWRVYPAIRPPNGDLPGTFGALHPHDAYLSLAGETGLIGLAAFAYGWLRVARSAASSLASRLPRERLLALGIAAGLVAVLVQGIFDTVGVVQMSFVWIPYTGLLLAAAGRVRI